ncbi:MAG: hypothetical protein QNJ38_17760 [Prochloraceae cyanobacterium]|nr:hypothetical protein [Prochloraceae cyanobacterium]
MGHSFLMDGGIWIVEGNWLEKNQDPQTVTGKTIVSWDRDNWFSMVTNLNFVNSDRTEISYQCRGRLGNKERYYTYVSKQSFLGRIEGEGWIAQNSIVQRYWVLGDPKKRTGFETFYRLDDRTYFLSSGILSGLSLTNTMEAKLLRHT